MGPIEAIKTCFQKYFVISGRATRSEFWWFYLFNILLPFATTPLDVILFGASEDGGFITIVTGLIVIIPLFTATVRRLHDTGRSGWFQLIPLAGVIAGVAIGAALGPLLGSLGSILAGLVMVASITWLLVVLATKSDAGENKYGAPDNTVDVGEVFE